jgi:hypothetical protein
VGITFRVINSVELYTGDILKVTLPPQYSISSNPTCESDGNIAQCTVLDSGLVQVNLNFTDDTDSFDVTVTGFINPSSGKKTDPF